MSKPEVTERDVLQASERIATLAVRTPLLESRGLSETLGVPVYLKLESLQETGSFKVRGAANKMLSLSPQEKETGVITISTGNHGRAVAYVAGRLGIRAVVCIPEGTAVNKIQAIRGLGAEIMVTGDTYDEAEERAFQLAAERGLTMINPYDDPLVIAGQGTAGLEIIQDLPEVGTVLVPVGGGGLIAGIGLALKAGGGKRRLVGVSMDRAPVMYHSLKAGHPITMEQEETLADALVGGIGADNQYSFALAQRLIDDFVLVSDEEIAKAMVCTLREHHLVVEGGGAVGIAALLGGKLSHAEGSTVVVVSGGNVDLPLLLELAEGR
ncbi:MAG TPA: pyridoxal-phosphate dependent enzyme [Chloroflexi bacterium]|nr:pyridoxal-phosphate dependent enzyme [Chloroflexota bacterium]